MMIIQILELWEVTAGSIVRSVRSRSVNDHYRVCSFYQFSGISCGFSLGTSDSPS